MTRSYPRIRYPTYRNNHKIYTSMYLGFQRIGRPKLHSGLAMVTVLTLRLIFKLSLLETEEVWLSHIFTPQHSSYIIR